MRIIFMGTPDFAVGSLAALIEAKKNVVAVVTTPDKPAGRGQKIHQSAVKLFALQHNIPVLQPEKLKDPLFIEQLKELKADIQVIVAFRMLPEIVWNMPPLGTINVHASLLPQYRGAAPINHAVINGETKTGVTTFALKHAIDTGNILLSKEVTIGENENAGHIHDKLMLAGAQILLQTLEGIETNTITPIPQEKLAENIVLKEAPKIFKDDCKIDWNMNTHDIHNKVRGLSPYPGAFSYLHDKIIKIYETEKEIIHHTQRIGVVESDGKSFLKIATRDGYIHILQLQMEGKKRMNTVEFLKGYRISS